MFRRRMERYVYLSAAAAAAALCSALRNQRAPSYLSAESQVSPTVTDGWSEEPKRRDLGPRAAAATPPVAWRSHRKSRTQNKRWQVSFVGRSRGPPFFSFFSSFPIPSASPSVPIYPPLPPSVAPLECALELNGPARTQPEVTFWPSFALE
uniref:Putative secreted protein n=1 Tax=Anopheles marajoara TaxID=58244 RepID=A0A2M4C6K8_9DIPT